jgi:transposase-like protein
MNTPQEEAPRRRRTREEVRQLVSAFQTSGLRAREFCQRHGLAPSTLRRNLQRAARASAPGQPPAVRFVAVKVNGAAPAAKPAPAAAGLEVVLTGGRRIAVGPGFDERTLGRLVRLLEGL